MLAQRYEQVRARALQPTAMRISDTILRRGMRSWMEAGWQTEMTEVAPAATHRAPPPEESFRQIVTVWASLLLGQAERSNSEQRSV
jgi:hypothetical protein